MLYAHKVLHAYLYGTRSLPCFPKHFERMCAVCVDVESTLIAEEKEWQLCPYHLKTMNYKYYLLSI